MKWRMTVWRWLLLGLVLRFVLGGVGAAIGEPWGMVLWVPAWLGSWMAMIASLVLLWRGVRFLAAWPRGVVTLIVDTLRWHRWR